MRTQFKSYVAALAILALIPAMMPAMAAAPGSRIEGMIVTVDGARSASRTSS